jgi:hypothetical protein
MYYEETQINGLWHWRGTPDGEWQPFDTARLQSKLLDNAVRITKLEKALRLIAEHKGKALLGDGRYDEGANAAFNQMADIAASVL